MLTLPLSQLLAPGTYRHEWWTTAEGERSVHFFDVVGDTIWGATARILYGLLTLVLGHQRD